MLHSDDAVKDSRLGSLLFVPYLRLTGPRLSDERRREVADRLTEVLVEVFTARQGPSAAEIRSRTTVHFTATGRTSCLSGAGPPGVASRTSPPR